MENSEFKHRNWIYKVDNFDDNFEFQVIDPNHTPKPKFLYKHFALNKFSIESLINNYLYASHPLQLNDPYDCNRYVFNLKSTSLTVFENFLSGVAPGINIKSLYKNNKQELIDWFIDGFWHIMYSKCGIISTSDVSNNIQMWAYYSGMKGFQIKIETEKVPPTFKGPFKIRYSNRMVKIPVKREFFLPVLYQITNKEKNWQHESEWRYLVVGPNEMVVPYDLFSKEQDSPHDRKFNYDLMLLKEITLAPYFFIDDNKKIIGKNHSVITISKSNCLTTRLRIKLLDFICDHPEIPISMIFWQTHSKYILKKITLVISKKSTRRFEMLTLSEQNVT